MAGVPGGKSCSLSSSPTPFAPFPFSHNIIVPTLLPWASFTSTTVLAALDSARRMIVDDTAATNSRLCFMATNYSQGAVLYAISSSQLSNHFLQFPRDPLGFACRFELPRRSDLYLHLT